MKYIFVLLFSTLFVLSCKDEIVDPPAIDKFEYEFSFNSGLEGWSSFFSDYPVGEEDFYELEFKHSNLPAPLDTTQMALKIAGNNHSDDLFCAVFRKLEGLEPNKTFGVSFNIDFASNAPIDAFGVGGSPDLHLGAGGINYEPENSVDNINHYRPNFESFIQGGASNDVFHILGKIGVSPEIPTPYMLINRNNLQNPIDLTTNSNGELWLMIATDSGFESKTTLFYKSIKIIINRK